MRIIFMQLSQVTVLPLAAGSTCIPPVHWLLALLYIVVKC